MEVNVPKKSAPVGKTTLGMLKGKSINTSVPSIAFRFNANDEELEQLYLSDNETLTDQNDESLKTSSTESHQADYSPKRDNSPMKDVFTKLSKRSASIDSNIPAAVSIEQSPPSSSNSWRLFSEIKGKLTKTVEEKISEIKSGTKCSTAVDVNTEDVAETVNKLAASKDNSSLSDSEDISENSASKFADIELSSNGEDEENDSLDKHIDDQLFNSEIVIKMPNADDPGGSGGGGGLRKRLKKTSDLIKVRYKNIETSNCDLAVETAAEALEDDTHQINEINEIASQSVVSPSLFQTYTKPSWLLIVAAVFIFSIGFSIFSLPNYLVGLLTGFSVLLVNKIINHNKSDINFKQLDFMIHKMELLNRVELLPPIKTYSDIAANKYKGWMNEYLGKYDMSTYHISATQTIYIQLDGSKLTLSSGNSVRLPKRAMWNEKPISQHSMNFTRHRIFNMVGARVKLLPDGLIRKRFWSKKYPICIEFSKMGREYSKLNTDDESPGEDHLLDTSTPNTPKKNRSSSDLEQSENINILSSIKDENDGDELMTTTLLDVNKIKIENDISEEVTSSTMATSIGDDVNRDLLTVNDNTPDDFDETSVEWDTVDDVLYGLTCVYLFTRTDRDKEEWYGRFIAATKHENISEEQQIEMFKEQTEKLIDDNQSAKSSPSHHAHHKKHSEPHNKDNYKKDYQKFAKQMQKVKSVMNEEIHEHTVNEISSKILWVNALLGRVLFDTVRQDDCVQVLQQRIQRKLSVIKLPYFIEELLITELNLGTSLPVIHRISEPIFDERGMWIDVNITYQGSIHGTLETKLNLMKLKKPPSTAGLVIDQEQPSVAMSSIPVEKLNELLTGAVYDSDLDDSAESSSEEDSLLPTAWGLQSSNPSTPTNSPTPPTNTTGNTTGKRILKMVDKIAASKYFQQATDYKLVKKALEGVSKTELKLRVELCGLVGVLSINIPPPPTHRIWIGFRGNPQLWLNATPNVGERSININHITSWIEKKLQQEFQKILVLPNMEDFVIPIMNLNLPE